MSHVDDGTLHALVDNALDARERSAVEAHLASCGDCARRFADATALARLVMSLLGALDEQPGSVRIVPPREGPAVAPDVTTGPNVVPIRSRMRTLRRVALAASVLVVAGVSYQVGRTRDAAAPATTTAAPARAGAPAARRIAMPRVVDAAPDSYVAAAPPSVRQKPRGGPRLEPESPPAERVDAVGGANGNVASAPRAVSVPLAAPPSLAAGPTDAARKVAAEAAPSPVASSQAAQSQAAQSQAAPSQAAPSQTAPSQTADRAEQASERRARSNDGSEQGQRVPQSATQAPQRVSSPAVQKAVALAGYTALEEDALPSITRRRYVSEKGTPILLLIMQPLPEAKGAQERDAASEFVVSTTNGRSTVRWHAHGKDYELQGALAPDSLVKLATLLK